MSAEQIKKEAERLLALKRHSTKQFVAEVSHSELTDLIAAMLPLVKDAERLDFLEDGKRTYWVAVQVEPSGNYVYAGRNGNLRAAIDAAIAECGGQQL